MTTRVDVLVVGGGVSGAAVARTAAGRGLRTLLVERDDFASGTSAASSKLIHGGLRYLQQGQWRLTRQSVRARERLLAERPGLVEPQPFLWPLYAGSRPGPTALRAAFAIGDAMAGRRTARRIDAAAAIAREPLLAGAALAGAIAYRDGVVDDARLVLRLAFDAERLGAALRNHVAATLVEEGGRVVGADLVDAERGSRERVAARVTVLATGVDVGGAPGAPRLRPLRGSHLVFAPERLPLRVAVGWPHPDDRRPVFAHPWEGAVVVGTTDLEHAGGDVVCSRAEADYLVRGVRAAFPSLHIDVDDAVSSFAGLRAIVAADGDRAAAPSERSRDSALWSRPGLVGVTGGKLTTHEDSAREVLAAIVRQGVAIGAAAPVPVGPAAPASDRRLAGRLGEAAATWIAARPSADRAPLGATPYSVAEIEWSLHHEHVRHLDDLLLRRTRIGLVAPGGGVDLLPRLETACRTSLGWDDARWSAERERYGALWNRRHAPPRRSP